MNYVYYKAKKGNFGDDLNDWLWPKIFGPEDNTDMYFFGIGSILYKENESIKNISNKKKIVFGTGVRPSYKPLSIDNSWDIKFLRGPLSSKYLGNQYEYITDAAYALRAVDIFRDIHKEEKKYEVSLMPYFLSNDYFDWKGICKKLGYNYISPFSEDGVEHTLREIAASKKIITEAMHGAIVADILRVPWSRFVLTTPHNEGGMVSEFKWMDWMHSIDIFNIEANQIKLYRRPFLNGLIKKMTLNMVNAEFFITSAVVEDILKKLTSENKFYLSSDRVINSIDYKINNKIEAFRKELASLEYIHDKL